MKIKSLFNRKPNNRKQNLEKILKIIDEVNRSSNDVKAWHTKHNMLISTCVELTTNLPLDEKKIVQAIIEKCRY